MAPKTAKSSGVPGSGGGFKSETCWNCGNSWEYYPEYSIVPPCPRCGAGAAGTAGNEPIMKNKSFNASELAKTARVLDESDIPNSNPELQTMVGDPDDYRSSPFAQFKPNPGNTQLPNPLSPVEGDEMFFAYMIPGATFQARDGSQWNILDYPWQGIVHIENRWYPRINAQVSLNDVRRSIEQWVEPVQVFIAAPAPGVDYGSLPVKIVDSPTSYAPGEGKGGFSTTPPASKGW